MEVLGVTTIEEVDRFIRKNAPSRYSGSPHKTEFEAELCVHLHEFNERCLTNEEMIEAVKALKTDKARMDTMSRVYDLTPDGLFVGLVKQEGQTFRQCVDDHPWIVGREENASV